MEDVQQKQDSLFRLPSALQDSLQIEYKIDSLRNLSQALDTLRIKQTLDSLQQLRLATAEAQAKVDSLQGLLGVSARANGKIQQLNQQLNQPLLEGRQQLQEKINKATRLEGVSSEGL